MKLQEVWAVYRSVRELRPKTIQDYEQNSRVHCHQLLDRDIQSITSRECIEFYQELKQHSLAQANKSKRILSSLFNFAAAYYDLNLPNPTRKIGTLRLLERLPYRKTRINNHQFPTFFDAIQVLPRQEQVWMQLLLFTGLRNRALSLARWEWIDWKRMTLTIPADIEKTGIERVVHLSEVPLDLLRRTHARARCPQAGPIFPFLQNRCYARIHRNTGIWCRPHDLRRTHASICTELGYNEYITKSVLGHSAGNDVTATYNHFGDDFLRDVNRRIVARILILATREATA